MDIPGNLLTLSICLNLVKLVYSPFKPAKALPVRKFVLFENAMQLVERDDPLGFLCTIQTDR